MLRSMMLCVIILGVLSGCTSKTEKKSDQDESQKVTMVYQNVIKQELLKTINNPKSYKEISWKKLQSSDRVSERIKKRVVFVAHAFSGKNIYGGSITKENIYFIGDTKPSLIIDFDTKVAFDEFLANASIKAAFAKTIWNMEKLHELYKKSASDSSAKENVKDFIYAIRHLSKEDQDFLEDAISNANNPISIAKNVALFLTMRLFPELIEELLYNEVTYNGTYK